MTAPHKICHATSIHPWNDVRIFHKECCSLAKQYDVTLVAANCPDCEACGVNVQGVTLPKSRLKRILHLRSFYDKLVAVDAEVYHFHDPELMPLGLRLKRRKGKRVIFDSHEDVPGQILDKEYIPSPLRLAVSRLYGWLEKRLLRHYDAVISVTDYIVDRLCKINPNTYMVTNYPALAASAESDPIKLQDRRGLVFVGGINPRYLHEHVVAALSEVPSEVRLTLLGHVEGDYLQRLQSMPEGGRIDYLGVVDHSIVASHLRKALVGVMLHTYSPNSGYRRGSLGFLKPFEYMMAGLPIIMTDYEVYKEIFAHYDCGICVDSYDLKAIADAINYLVAHPERAAEMGRNGQRAVREKYNWSVQEAVLFKLYADMIAQS